MTFGNDDWETSKQVFITAEPFTKTLTLQNFDFEDDPKCHLIEYSTANEIGFSTAIVIQQNPVSQLFELTFTAS